MYAAIGVTPRMLDEGYVVSSFQYRDRRKGLVAEFDLSVLKDETAFPFRLMLEQHKLCYILRDMLERDAPGRVLMRHKVTRVEQNGEGVTAHVETPDGAKTFKGRYIVGCDGGRSQVRKSMNVTFDGFTYGERFLVLSTRYDFQQFGYGLTNYIADPQEWCALFKVPGADGSGVWRVVFAADAQAPPEAIFDEAAVQARIQGFHPQDGRYDVVHRNLYDVHQRVASCYRDGRLLIAGDAAHINNPLGGMGMNFGIHDAFNLAEGLCDVIQNGASEDRLDRYDRQRRTVAQEYLQRQTIENKNNIEQRDPAASEAFYQSLRAIVADRDALRAYLRRIAMIEGLERAASIV